jgi:hypothetical protein
MQCSSTPTICQPLDGVVPASASVGHWEELLNHLPADLNLEATARETKALCRCREVHGALDLLRLVLAYSVCDWPLRLVAAWYTLLGRGSMSMIAVRQRLRHSVRWLGFLLGVLLQDSWRCTSMAGIRVRLMDATVICRPGSQGTDWRVHLGLDLGSHCLCGIEVTDAHGAETLARFPIQPGEIRVGDRGYAYPSGLGPVLQARGLIVVRTSWQNLRLEDEAGGKVDVATWLRRAFLPTSTTAQEQVVWLPTPQGRFAVRLIAHPLDARRAEAARRRARKTARKNKHTVDDRTLLAAGFVLVLTNLPAEAWPATQVLELYRLRWQIEIRIKRLKSLLDLDGLRAQDRDLAQAYLLGKLLGAVLAEGIGRQLQNVQPEWWTDTERPINHWRLTRLVWEVIAETVRGPIPWMRILQKSTHLKRFLCDEPRKRRPQWQTAQRLLHGLSSC